MSEDSSIIEPGTAVGDYEVLATLGEGGMGIVYLAQQNLPKRLVALKALRAVRRRDPRSVRRFDRERAFAVPAHPNIVTVYESFVHDEVPFISMELVDGGSLRRYIGEMTFAEIVGVLEALLAALEHVAKEAIVHRDIKPENVMVNTAGAVKITDFGIARILADESLTSTGDSPGTPRYMAPEQSGGKGAMGAWTDLYSLGLVTYELLAGHLPAQGDRTLKELVLVTQHHFERRAWQPSRQRSTLRFAQWLARMLEEDPGRRYVSAAAASEGLEACAYEILPDGWRHRDPLARIAQPVDTISDAGALEPRSVSTADRHGPSRSRRRRSIVVSSGRHGAVAVVAAALAAAGYGGHRLIVSPTDSAMSLPASISSTGLQLDLPAGWERMRATALAPALGITEPIRAGLPDRDLALTAGIVKTDDPSLLAIKRVRTSVQPPEVVMLGSLQALRYRSVKLHGQDGQWTLYAVSTADGVATIACPARPRAFALDCERAARTLELTDLRGEKVGPSDTYAQAVGAALGVVDQARRIGGRALANARTPTSQARAAAGLAKDYETAKEILARVKTRRADRGINRELVAALQRHVTAYQRLARAVRQGSPRRYRDARRAIGRAGVALDRSLRRVRSAGYRVVR